MVRFCVASYTTSMTIRHAGNTAHSIKHVNPRAQINVPSIKKKLLPSARFKVFAEYSFAPELVLELERS